MNITNTIKHFEELLAPHWFLFFPKFPNKFKIEDHSHCNSSAVKSTCIQGLRIG